MSRYHRLALRKFPRLQDRETDESRYWRRYSDSNVTYSRSLCSTIQFSPVASMRSGVSTCHDFVVTCGQHVHLHCGVTGKKLRSFSRFQGEARSGVLRGDGRLLAAGDDAGRVVVFESESKALLRVLTGHKAAVRAVKWTGGKGGKVASASDDKTVRLWDVSTGECVLEWEISRFLLPNPTGISTKGHDDYIRAMDAQQFGGNAASGCWVTGSYDGKLKVWDPRQKSAASIANYDAPLEAVKFLPGGGMVAGGGVGGTVKVWDMVSGMKLSVDLHNHQKSVSCLTLDGVGRRLLSGSLDWHVKIYDLVSFKVAHGLKFPAPLLSLAISPDDSLLAAGTSDCALTLRRRQPRKGGPDSFDAHPRPPRSGTFAYLARGGGRGSKVPEPSNTVVGLSQKRLKPLKSYDKCLQQFKYREALDEALASNRIVIVVSVLEELEYRRGLVTALSGRDESSLERVLALLVRHITNPRYAMTLTCVALLVADMYAGVLGESEVVDELFGKLKRQVDAESVFLKELASLSGQVNAILGAASVASCRTEVHST